MSACTSHNISRDSLEALLKSYVRRIKENSANMLDRLNADNLSIDIFDLILNKEHLERNDLEILIDKIIVFESYVEIRLKANIDPIIRNRELPEDE